MVLRSDGHGVDSLFAVPHVFDQGCQAKVSDLDIHVPVQEEVPELEITVNDMLRVHVLARGDELY